MTQWTFVLWRTFPLSLLSKVQVLLEEFCTISPTRHYKNAFSCSNCMTSSRSFLEKRWLTDSENIPENTNYDVKWKCIFPKYKYIFFSVSKRAMTIAKTSAFNRGKKVSHRKKSVIVGLQTSINKTWEALPGKTVMWWKELNVKTAIAWNLGLSSTSWLKINFQPFSEPWFFYLKKRHNNN